MSGKLIIYPENRLHKKSGRSPALIRDPDDSLLVWIEKYLYDKVYGIQSIHTFDAKARDLKSFVHWYQSANGHLKIEDWHARDTQGFLNFLERDGKKPTTINRMYASLRRFARWTSEQGTNPFRLGLPTQDISILSIEEPDCKKLSAKEMHRLFKATDNLVLTEKRANSRPRRNQAIFALLYYSGLRVSELTQLTLGQYKERYLHNVKRKGKIRSRAIYLSSACRKYLDTYLEEERNKDNPEQDSALPLFCTTNGISHLTRMQVGRVLEKIANEASKNSPDTPIHLHPHRLRHTFGAMFREHTGSDTETQQALGHVSMNYVGRYVRKTEEEREQVLDGMGNSF